MSNPFHVLYCHEHNEGDLLSNILVYELVHITKKGGMCVIMISFSEPGFMRAMVQWNDTVHDK